MNSAAREAAWIRVFVEEIRGESLRVILYGVNEGALALSKHAVFHQRSKHINVAFQYIRQLVKEGWLTLRWVPTSEMIADGLTKPIGRIMFRRFLSLLGISDQGMEAIKKGALGHN